MILGVMVTLSPPCKLCCRLYVVLIMPLKMQYGTASSSVRDIGAGLIVWSNIQGQRAKRIELVHEAVQQVDVALLRCRDRTAMQCYDGRICDAERIYLSVAIRWLPRPAPAERWP